MDSTAVTVAGDSAASLEGLEAELGLQVQGLGYVEAVVEGSGLTAHRLRVFLYK